MSGIILASRSKRRSEILKSCNIPHSAVPSGVTEEHVSAGRPAALVIRNAKRKAEAVARKRRKGIIIGVDTLVLFKGKLIGKPRTKDEAGKMLRGFSGSRLSVYSGICVIDAARSRSASGSDRTTLYIKKINIADVDKYFRLLGPYDKAGGFSIEGVGSMVFDDVRGSYFNVLGLPMRKLAELFRKIGLDLLDFVGR